MSDEWEPWMSDELKRIRVWLQQGRAANFGAAFVVDDHERAPRCDKDMVPMLVLRADWFTCPFCGSTQDFEPVSQSGEPHE